MGKSRKRQQQQIRKKREELLRQNSCRGKTNRTLASSGNPTDVKTTKTIPSTTQAAEVTTSLQQILEDVLADLLAWSKSSNIPFDDFRYRSEGNAKSWKPWSVKRWKTRLGDILDTLKSYGFRFDQILKAVSTIIASMSSGKDHYNQWITAPYHHFLTVECVLDWLCLHLPSDQLPAIFTEGQVRDDNRIGKESMTVTVITAKHQTSHQNDLELDKLQPPTTKLSTLKDRSSSVPKKDDDEEQKWKVAQKDWLLSQYQYEEESLSEESNSDNDSYEQPSMIPASESPTTETEEQRLHQLKKLIQELDEDLGNEASNYMRSKFEIKELHKELKLMRQQLSGMERKMERQSAKSKAALKDETDESKEKEEQDDDPFFSLFDEDAVTLRQDHQPTGTDTDIHGQLHQSFPEIDWEERIPKSWTGKTPKILLQEWCQKEQLPKPSYEKLESNGCRLIVHKTLSEQIEVEALGPFSKYNDAQHLASTKALYQIQTNLPLYHLLPPYYRTLWLSWRETDKAEISKDGAARERNRQNEIEQLLQCLPMDVPSHGTFQPITKMNYKEEHGNSKPCRISSPAETKHNADKKTTRNFQEIQKRSAYQKMLRFRKQLPIYQSKQMILETIKRNSVSIICAETGSGTFRYC
jgi:ATP-dependent RNA helicase DHX29